MVKLLTVAFLGAFLIGGTNTSASADDLLSSGTVFAVSNDGWFLTNAHVVKGCSRIEVKGLGVSDIPKIDEINDFAALKVKLTKPIPPIVFRKNPVRLGEDIVAIGFPLLGLLSDSIKVTTGNVNALAGINNDTRFLQISTPIQPGNSGGPIVDKDGLLIGITTATLSKDTADRIGITAQNVNFAIRSSVAELFLQSQNIAYSSAEKPANPTNLPTADLAEKITPSVFQVLCYGQSSTTVAIPQAQSQVSISPVQIPSAGLIDADGYDAIGFDYSTIKDVAFEDCKAACATDAQCQAFTYNKHYNFCFLKRDVVALIRNADAAAGYTSAKSSNVIYSNFTVVRDMDYPGGDYRRISRSDYLSCLMACVKDNVCKAFSYVRRKNECWLKNQLGQSRAITGVELGIK